jgi:hypothetical protein
MALAATLFISACSQNPASSRPLSPDEQKLREESEIFNRTVLEWTLALCGVGALAGLAAGRDLASVLIGCGAGAVVGFGTGYYVEQKRRSYRNDEQRLDAMIADVQKDNQQLERTLTASKKVVKADVAKIERIDEQLKNGEITAAQAVTRMNAVDDNREFLEDTVANLKKRRDDWKQIASETRRDGSAQKQAEMRQQIATLERQIAALEGELDTLIERREVSPVA